MRALVVWTTAPDLREARKLARFLVDRKLAACVSLRSGFESVYSWKKKIETASEILLVIKTSKAKWVDLEKMIRSRHSYKIPEVLAVEAASGSKEYLNWIESALR